MFDKKLLWIFNKASSLALLDFGFATSIRSLVRLKQGDLPFQVSLGTAPCVAL